MQFHPTRFFLPEHLKRRATAQLPRFSSTKHSQSFPGQQDNYVVCYTKATKTKCSEFFSHDIHDYHVCVALCLFVCLFTSNY